MKRDDWLRCPVCGCGYRRDVLRLLGDRCGDQSRPWQKKPCRGRLITSRTYKRWGLDVSARKTPPISGSKVATQNKPEGT
jgi:hypothetical protein